MGIQGFKFARRTCRRFLGEPSDIHFPTIDDVILLVNEAGPGCFIYKRDLKAAYRQFPVDPADYKYLGYHWRGKYYFDTRLCMGQRTAALACQRSTRAVVYIMLSNGHTIVVYLDDFIGVEARSNAWRSFYYLGDLLIELGLRENVPKACPPSQRQIVLGVLFDTVSMTISITPDRLAEIRSLVEQWLVKRTASKRQLQSLLGKLMFISKCVRQSRIFVNRIIATIRGLKHHYYKIKLTQEFRKDLLWWREFASIFNGVSVLPDHQWSEPDAVFSTDACLSGCGGVFGDTYFRSEFPVSVMAMKLHIHDLELLSIVVAVRLWKDQLRGKRVIVYCDNEPSVFALNSGRTSGDFTAACLRELWLHCCSVQLNYARFTCPGWRTDYLITFHARIYMSNIIIDF